MTTAPLIAGIDLGGTKIEARVFDAALQEVARNRIATPSDDYDALIKALVTQVAWIEAQGQVTTIGLGTPGLINPVSGVMLTSNLPATGHPLGADLSTQVGRAIAVIKDSRAFALSEALHGAGVGARAVTGVIIGTGVSCGQVVEGVILPDLNGQAGEFGHTPLPAAWVAKHDLPLLPCGCGLSGCYETYLAGPGLVELARQMTGQDLQTRDILADHPQLRTAWIDLAVQFIALIIRSTDPEVIVLGGGMGMADGVVEDIAARLPPLLLTGTRPPLLVQALHGDASGALGAALFARGVA